MPSLPYLRGREAREADDKKLAAWKQSPLTPEPARSVNPLVGVSGKRWHEGYEGLKEFSTIGEGQSNGTSGIAVHGVGGHPGDNPRGDRTAVDRLQVQTTDRADRKAHEVGDDENLPVQPANDSHRPARTDVFVFGLVLIVDYSSLLHRAFHAGQPSRVHAVRSMFETLSNAIKSLSPEYMIFAMDGGHKERSTLSPSYKSHRPPMSQELRDQLRLGERVIGEMGWPSIRVDGWEADDVIASLVKTIMPLSQTGEVFIATSDKDALQLVAKQATIYHPWDKGTILRGKAVVDKYGVNPEQIGDFLALTGDSSDGVPGIEGIGPKTAAELLKEHKSLAGILAAAATIKGKIGERLRSPDGQQLALLCRQLVEMCDELPVGTHWADFKLCNPSEGWVENLRVNGLGSVVTRLQESLQSLHPKKEIETVVRKVSPAVSLTFTRELPAIDQVPSPPVATGTPAVTDETASWPKGLCELPSEYPRLQGYQAVYMTGRSLAGKELQTPGWRAGSAYQAAEDDGRLGRPFNLPLYERLDAEWKGPIEDESAEIMEEEMGTDRGIFGEDVPSIPFEPTATVEIESVEPPAPVEPLPNAQPLPFEDEPSFIDDSGIEPSDWPTSASSEETMEDLPSPPATSPAGLIEVEHIDSLSQLMLLCAPDSDDCEYWQVMAVRAARELVEPSWRLPISDHSEAITTLMVLQERAASKAVFIAQVNQVFDKLFEGDGMTATAARKKPDAKSKPQALTDDMKREMVRVLCITSPSTSLDWDRRKGKPMSDEELAGLLIILWSPGYKREKPACMASAITQSPKVWFGQTHTRGPAGMEGQELLDLVRDIFKLKQPVQAKPEKPAKASKSAPVSGEKFLRIATDIVTKRPEWFHKSPYDTRTEPSDESLQELADSLKQNGQWNAVLARTNGEHIAGWRRIRAAKLIGLELQVRIVECDDLTARRMVLLENGQREPLTEREQCEAYNGLWVEYEKAGRTQEQLANELSMDHSTLSNKLRLKSLTPDVWDCYERGEFSIHQIRKIATHAAAPEFLTPMMFYINRHSRPGEQASSSVFDNAMLKGFEAAYRPMTKTATGDGCQFRPSASQKAQLGIIEIEHPFQGTIQVATNVEAWEKLNKAAKTRTVEKQTKIEQQEQQEAPKLTAPQKAQKERQNHLRAELVELSWAAAYAAAIAGRFDKARKQDTLLLMRVGILVQQSLTKPEQMSVSDLWADDITFAERLRETVIAFFACEGGGSMTDWRDLGLAELKKVADFLGVDPALTWKPYGGLLATCSDRELKSLRDELGLETNLEDKDRAHLQARIQEAWCPGGPGVSWCPDMFLMKGSK